MRVFHKWWIETADFEVATVRKELKNCKKNVRTRRQKGAGFTRGKDYNSVMNKGVLQALLPLFFLSSFSHAEEGGNPVWKEVWTLAVFDRVDLDDDGFITRAEAQRSKGVGTRTDIVVPFTGVDGNADGKISRKEFVEAVKKSKTMELIAEDRDSDLGLAYRPKAGRETTQDVGLRFKF